MISTRTLSNLPNPAALARIGQSVAMLDAILFPDDWDDRYHSFAAKWSRGERVFSMRDGGGDFYFVSFVKAGAVLHGFAHESVMSPWSRQRSKEKARKPFPGLVDGLPKKLDYAKTAKSFCENKNEITFCAWSLGGVLPWQMGDIAFPRGKDPDGSEALLVMLDGKPKTYERWAKGYVGRAISLAAVEKIYAHEPLTNALVRAIEPETELSEAKREAKSIGYPA